MEIDEMKTTTRKSHKRKGTKGVKRHSMTVTPKEKKIVPNREERMYKQFTDSIDDWLKWDNTYLYYKFKREKTDKGNKLYNKLVEQEKKAKAGRDEARSKLTNRIYVMNIPKSTRDKIIRDTLPFRKVFGRYKL